MAYTFGKRKESVFLKAFPIEIYYSDNWTSYKKHIEKDKHKIGKKYTKNRKEKSYFKNKNKKVSKKNDLLLKDRIYA